MSPDTCFAHSDTSSTSTFEDVVIHHSLIGNDNIKQATCCSCNDDESNNNNNKSNNNKQRKRVSFGKKENNKVYDIVHINDLKQETDTTMVWYTKEEYKQISKDCQHTIDRHVDILLDEILLQEEDYDDDDDDHDHHQQQHTDDNDDDEWYCIRGLELKMEHTLKKLDDTYIPIRHRRISNALNAVLDEQDYQYTNDIDDDNYLAYLYFNHTRQSQIDAKLIGHEDWKEIM